MPKKKTGARKKAEKQKERQRGIREARERPITEYFCNAIMVRFGLKGLPRSNISSHFCCVVERDKSLMTLLSLFIFRNVISVKGKLNNFKNSFII